VRGALPLCSINLRVEDERWQEGPNALAATRRKQRNKQASTSSDGRRAIRTCSAYRFDSRPRQADDDWSAKLLHTGGNQPTTDTEQPTEALSTSHARAISDQHTRTSEAWYCGVSRVQHFTFRCYESTSCNVSQDCSTLIVSRRCGLASCPSKRAAKSSRCRQSQARHTTIQTGRAGGSKKRSTTKGFEPSPGYPD
jgi:hypothetical protein